MRKIGRVIRDDIGLRVVFVVPLCLLGLIKGRFLSSTTGSFDLSRVNSVVFS